ARRQQRQTGEVARKQATVRDVLLHQRREVLHEERVDRALAPAPPRRAAVPGVDDALRLHQRRPAAFPGAIAEIDVLDVDRREHTLVEAAEGEKLLAVVRRRPAAGEKHRVEEVLVEAIEVEEADRAEAPASMDLSRLPARLRLVDEVD